jgi:uncharacterized repeat protein (TIGR01451 family)
MQIKYCTTGRFGSVKEHLKRRFFRSFGKAATTFLTIAALINWNTQGALPPAGTSIGNQASATYKDASGVERTATSNEAITIVQQVAAFTLTQDNTKPGAPGGQVIFPHTLQNTGNGTDTFALTVENLTGDNFDLTGVAIYADANGDGLPDSSTPITSTGPLTAGSVFKFVVVGTIPSTAVANQQAQVKVTATSGFNSSVTAFNTDTAIVSQNAVVSVTKSISANSGLSPSGPYTITITYNNTGNNPATDITLMDVIQPGFVYVLGSARWSVSGSTPLTDGAGGDPTGISYDYNVTAPGRVTAVIASLAPGQSGSLTFQVNVASGLSPQIIPNTVTYQYNDGTSVVGPYVGNTVNFTVLQVASVTLTGQTIASAAQGSIVTFTNVLVNTGNGVDTFDIILNPGNTFPSGTTFSLFKEDGQTPLLDSNNNGTPDTGPLQPGQSYNVIVKAYLPSGYSGTGPFTLTKTARSAYDPTKTATTTDQLNAVTANTVDLTNDQPAGQPGALGVGQGPEATPVKTVTVNPGQVARYTLYVKNTSSVADNYNLDASTDPTFATIGFPPGFTVTFRDINNTIISSTGILQPGESKLIYAEVFVPAGTPPGTYAGYWRARSPVSGAQDIKYDALIVNTYRSLSISPDNTGQVAPGGTIVYTHTIANNGNVIEGDGVTSTVSLSLSTSTNGFGYVIYWDKNNNGSLDPTDPIINDLSALTGGTGGASTSAGLDPGEIARIFVKVFAPATALAGQVDVTTLTVTTTGGSGTPPPAVRAVDTTTVIAGDIILIKEQALDINRDGNPDAAFTKDPITTGAVPGASILYRITVRNQGSAAANEVVVTDTTPVYTTYDGLATTSKGTVTQQPNVGETGTFKFTIGTLNPGETATILFRVKINN